MIIGREFSLGYKSSKVCSRPAIKSSASKSKDVDAFIRTKIFELLPKGTFDDLKHDLASNKKWKSISFNDSNCGPLIKQIKDELTTLKSNDLIPQLENIIKTGGILRRGLKGLSFQDLCVSNADEISNHLDKLFPSYQEFDSAISSPFSEPDNRSDEFDDYLNLLDSVLIKGKSMESLEVEKIIDQLIYSLPRIILQNNLEIVLLKMHTELYESKVFNKRIAVPSFSFGTTENDYKSLIHKATETARADFVTFITEIEKSNVSKGKILKLSCIVLALSFVFVEKAQNNKFAKQFNLIRRSLPSSGEFQNLYTFTTCFSRRSITMIDIFRFDEDSQILAFALKTYNHFVIESIGYFNAKLITPMHEYDYQLEDLISSYDGKSFDSNYAKKLTSKSRFWRLDSSTAYQALRDLDFYTQAFGVKFGDHMILNVGLDKYYRLDDAKKKQILSLLDAEAFSKDIEAAKRAQKARENGDSSFIGADGLPVFCMKINQGA